MTAFCMLPCSPDYLFPFGSGARGAIIVSSGPSRYTFRAPQIPENSTCTAWLGIDRTATQRYCGVVHRIHPNFTRKPMPADLKTPSIRPWRKTGFEFPCTICGKIIYRRASQIARGIVKTCGAPECKSASMSGDKNPFWGRSHPPEVVDRIKAGRALALKHKRKSRPSQASGARAKRTKVARLRWFSNRDVMLTGLKPLEKDKTREQKRSRHDFSRWQRENWTGDKCIWCDAVDDLVLDHIHPVVCGGKNKRFNAQTLCRSCNLWKMVYVDRPLYLASLGLEGGWGVNPTTGKSGYRHSSTLER
jgi:5-methylcytosine-specific restriction endonuclease McrA